jgi:hypothetical protein
LRRPIGGAALFFGNQALAQSTSADQLVPAHIGRLRRPNVLEKQVGERDRSKHTASWNFAFDRADSAVFSSRPDPRKWWKITPNYPLSQPIRSVFLLQIVDPDSLSCMMRPRSYTI